MPKVVLIGSPQTQWNIGKTFRPGGVPIELTEEEIKKHKDVILEEIIEKEIPKKEEPKPKVKPKKEPKKYTKKELNEIAKKKGIEGLRKVNRKLKFRSINEGIKEILEAQK